MRDINFLFLHSIKNQLWISDKLGTAIVPKIEMPGDPSLMNIRGPYQMVKMPSIRSWKWQYCKFINVRED